MADVGRPSKYEPGFCERLVARSAEGWSLSEIAHEFDVARSTIDQWAVDRPEFSEALKRAKTAEQSWWERQARENLTADRFNAPVWKKSVEARFREDYTERTESKTTLAADASIAGLMARIAENGRRIQDREEK